MADKPRSTRFPVVATNLEHQFWTDLQNPYKEGSALVGSELLEEVPSFSYRDGVVNVNRKDIDPLMNFLDEYAFSEGSSSIPPRVRNLSSGWHQDLWDRSESVAPNYPLIPTEDESRPDPNAIRQTRDLIAESRFDEMLPASRPPEPPEGGWEPPPSLGQIVRRLAPAVRKRLFPFIQAAQMAWGTLSDEQKTKVQGFLEKPAHELFGMKKPGIEYLRSKDEEQEMAEGGMANGNNADRSAWYIPKNIDFNVSYVPQQSFGDSVTGSSLTARGGVGIEGALPVHLRGQYDWLNLKNPDWALEKKGYEGTVSVMPSGILRGLAPDWMTLDKVWVTAGRGGTEFTDPTGEVHESGTRTRGVGAQASFNNLGLGGEWLETGEPGDPDRAITGRVNYPFLDGEISAELQRILNANREDETRAYVGAELPLDTVYEAIESIFE